MRRQFGQVIEGARPDRHRDGIVSFEGLLQRGDILVFGVEVRVGEDKRLAADLPGAAEYPLNRLPCGGERVGVSYQQGRLIPE